MEHFRRLEAMYMEAPINRFFRPTIHIKEGEAQVRMVIRPDMHHSAHAAHGAVYFKLLDDAAFFAVQSLVSETFVLTVSFNVYLLAPVVDGEMVSTGRVVHQSKRLFIAESTIEVDGKNVARGSGTFLRSAIRLEEKIGYLSS